MENEKELKEKLTEVEVRVDGELILSIGTKHLLGRDDIEQFEKEVVWSGKTFLVSLETRAPPLPKGIGILKTFGPIASTLMLQEKRAPFVTTQTKKSLLPGRPLSRITYPRGARGRERALGESYKKLGRS